MCNLALELVYFRKFNLMICNNSHTIAEENNPVNIHILLSFTFSIEEMFEIYK